MKMIQFFGLMERIFLIHRSFIFVRKMSGLEEKRCEAKGRVGSCVWVVNLSWEDWWQQGLETSAFFSSGNKGESWLARKVDALRTLNSRLNHFILLRASLFPPFVFFFLSSPCSTRSNRFSLLVTMSTNTTQVNHFVVNLSNVQKQLTRGLAVLLVLSLFGNSFSLLVFRQRKLRLNAIALLFSAASVFNILVLHLRHRHESLRGGSR